MHEYVAPQHGATAFNCPWCNAFATQQWGAMFAPNRGDGFVHVTRDKVQFTVAKCARCQTPSLWYGTEMIHPLINRAPRPNKDLSADIRKDYDEAASIAAFSPRGAAALLRLCIQKLCKQLGEPGTNINADIAALVKKGLPQAVQQALDVVRVVGNNAVHPGEMDIRDDATTVSKLFVLVNFVAEKTISEPKEIAAIYSGLPQNNLDAISKRDS